MPQQLRVLATLLDDLGSVLSTSSGFQLFVTQVPGDPVSSFGICEPSMYMVHKHTGMQTTHTQ